MSVSRVVLLRCLLAFLFFYAAHNIRSHSSILVPHVTRTVASPVVQSAFLGGPKLAIPPTPLLPTLLRTLQCRVYGLDCPLLKGENASTSAARNQRRSSNFSVDVLPCQVLGATQTFTIVSLDDAGVPMSLGGDWFVVFFVGPRYRSRPSTVDNGDGSYTVTLRVPNDVMFVDSYTLSIKLEWSALGGLMSLHDIYNGPMWQFSLIQREVTMVLTVVANPDECGLEDSRPAGTPPFLNAAMSSPSADTFVPCAHNHDFTSFVPWGGHWLRLVNGAPCAPPYCSGNASGLFAAQVSPRGDWRGWVYRLPGCYFHLPTVNDTRTCFAGKWVHMLGDSNHPDTVRNLVGRWFQAGYDPNGITSRTFSVRTAWGRWTNFYNGHENGDKSGQGWGAFHYQSFISALNLSFAGPKFPNAVIVNSGLHDGLRNPTEFRLKNFTDDLEMGLRLLLKPGLLGPAPPSPGPRFVDVHNSSFGIERATGRLVKSVPPIALWRSTVTPVHHAGSDDQLINSQRISLINALSSEKLAPTRRFLFADAFDVSWAWSVSYNHSDGVHYGKAPWSRVRPYGNYPLLNQTQFVDEMVAVVLLNAFCGKSAGWGIWG